MDDNQMFFSKHQSIDVIGKHCGAAFVAMLFVLIFLSITTLLGLNSIQNTTTQTKIARNIQQKQVSFRNANTSVGIAEVQLFTEISDCFNDFINCDIDFAPVYLGEDTSQNQFWQNASAANSSSKGFGEFVVEYFNKRPIAGDNDREIHLYRLTSRASEHLLELDGSVNSASVAPTIVQSMIQICVRVDGSGIC